MFELAALTLGLHLGTYHFDRERGYEELNPGVYAVYDGWTAGAYRNSEHGTSVYAGYTFRRVLGTPVDVTAGVVRYGAWGPLLVPSYKLPSGLRLSLLLPVEKRGGGIHASWEF